MCQRTQTPEDGKLRRALQNMKYKACTMADISFLKTLVCGQPANKVKLNQARFQNVSIIVGPNAHRDEYNILGSVHYANDTKQSLHHFYSMDTLGSPKMNEHKQRNISNARVKNPQRASNVLSLELQHIVWNLPHEASQHCAGKLSICHGMPVIVKHNIATPCCVTNGAEGTVVGWKFPISWAAQDVICCLPNDDTLTITRQQVQVLPNFFYD
ncbi:hypothetical protein K439DRAFT_1650033 [Ramaria rubella]|nr:hypothetical protein K439DRAFT_1650033 [Ramaria rubella]